MDWTRDLLYAKQMSELQVLPNYGRAPGLREDEAAPSDEIAEICHACPFSTDLRIVQLKAVPLDTSSKTCVSDLYMLKSTFLERSTFNIKI